MSLKQLQAKRSEQGFTIVELLIVIVIIGILAAIVIVAYTGITQRANNQKYQANADAIKTIAETINADSGSYPTGTDTTTLKASFNANSTTKLPAGVDITFWTGTDPTNAAAETAAKASPSSYTVKVCAAGVKVFYPVQGGALASIQAGTCA